MVKTKIGVSLINLSRFINACYWVTTFVTLVPSAERTLTSHNPRGIANCIFSLVSKDFEREPFMLYTFTNVFDVTFVILI